MDEAFFSLWAIKGLIMLFWLIKGNCSRSVVTLVSFSSNLNKNEKNLKILKIKNNSIKIYNISKINALILVLPFEEISLCPDSPVHPCFRLHGGEGDRERYEYKKNPCV